MKIQVSQHQISKSHGAFQETYQMDPTDETTGNKYITSSFVVFYPVNGTGFPGLNHSQG